MKRILVLLSVVIGMGVLFLVLAPMALALDPPVSGDERATAYPGKVAPGDCQMGGQPIPGLNGSEGGTYLDLPTVEGYTVQSVFVQGADAYNLYQDPPYQDLHAPLGPNGQPQAISYWFACGIVAEVDTTPPTVTAKSPDEDDTVSRTATVTATFSEEVQNVTSSTFILERQIAVKKSPAKYVLVDATVSPVSPNADDSYVLDPVQDLPKGNYRATITTDVTDMADNALEDPVVWTFTVKK
jgi:hypothetical protein